MSRIITNGDDWMRDVEKRVGRQERRPAPASFADQLGPGITQRARAIVDWNDPGTLRNGWYFSDVLSLNTPDPMVAWTGMVTITSDNRGIQRLTSHEVGPRTFVRTFAFGTSAIPTFTPYRAEHEDTGWFTMPLGNGWTNYNSGFEIAQYRRFNGRVEFTGLIVGTSRTDPVFFVTPSGFRHGGATRVWACGSSEQPGTTRIDTSGGGVMAWSNGEVEFVSLAQISYIADA
jgi:hypothetical protein